MTEKQATLSPLDEFCEGNLENHNLSQLSTVTPLPSSDVSQDAYVAGLSTSVGSKLSRVCRGRSSRSRGSGGSSALSGLISGKISATACRDNSQSDNLSRQHEMQNESANDYSSLITECTEARNGVPFLTGSQSDPTLTVSSSNQESRIKKPIGRAVPDTNRRSLEPNGREVLESAAEKVMDAYIEKFSVIGYTNSGGCIGINDNLMPLRIDPSRRPSSLQEAICMYIDYLVCENELRTRISECSVSSPPPLADFHREEYYRDVMCRPVNFPTARFREWLKLYNVDIEITDPDGKTVSQTTFAPTAPVGGLSYESPYVQQDNLLPLPNFTWQLGSGASVGVGPGGFAVLQRRRSQRARIDSGSQSAVTSWVPDTEPAGAQSQHRQAVSYLPQYSLPALPPARIESCCGSQQMNSSTSSSCYNVSNDVMPHALNTIQNNTGNQQTQQTPFMEFDAGIMDLADQRHQLYSNTGEQEPTAQHMLHDLDESAMFAFGIMLKNETQNDRPACGVTQLHNVDMIVQPDDNVSGGHAHLGSAEALITNIGDERLNLETFTISNSGTSSMKDANLNAVEHVDQSAYRQAATHSERPVVDQRILRNVEISREAGSVVVDCRLGYDILRTLESSTTGHSLCGETEVGAISQENTQAVIDLFPVTPSECRSSYGCQVVNICSRPSTAANEMKTRLSTAAAMQVISGSTDVQSSSALSTLIVGNEHVQPGFGGRSGICGPTGRGVDWHPSITMPKSDGHYKELANVCNAESSLNCNTEVGFGSFSETAAAVASLEFEDMSPVPYTGRTGETLGKRCWPDPLQWPSRTSFNNSYNPNSACDEPALKSAKVDNLVSDNSQYQI
jgi:hypothetical protein